MARQRIKLMMIKRNSLSLISFGFFEHHWMLSRAWRHIKAQTKSERVHYFIAPTSGTHIVGELSQTKIIVNIFFTHWEENFDFSRFWDKIISAKFWNLDEIFLSQNQLKSKYCAQHDELESNLKKIPHRNGIWGLEAIVM